jgi:hypothetical protein
MALPSIQLNLSPHAVNGIMQALQTSIGMTQNVLQEVQTEINAWQALQQRAAALAEEQQRAAAAAAAAAAEPLTALHLVGPQAS